MTDAFRPDTNRHVRMGPAPSLDEYRERVRPLGRPTGVRVDRFPRAGCRRADGLTRAQLEALVEPERDCLNADLRERFIGVTPETGRIGHYRQVEIGTWLRSAGADSAQRVAIDDDRSLCGPGVPPVAPDPDVGLDDASCREVLAILAARG